jgi:hypothetical protein
MTAEELAAAGLPAEPVVVPAIQRPHKHITRWDRKADVSRGARDTLWRSGRRSMKTIFEGAVRPQGTQCAPPWNFPFVNEYARTGRRSSAAVPAQSP